MQKKKIGRSHTACFRDKSRKIGSIQYSRGGHWKTTVSSIPISLRIVFTSVSLSST